MSSPGTTEWTCRCKDCGAEFRYADTSYQANRLRGFSRPERCPECRAQHAKEIGSIGQPYVPVRPLYPGVDHTKLRTVLGRLNHRPRPHMAEHVVPPDEPPDKFGITDDKIVEMFRWFVHDPKLQVAVVVGPTGSGKSTYFPYRLVHPPRSYVALDPDPRDSDTRSPKLDPTGKPYVFDASDIPVDLFHRHGQIVVTQPRIQATRGIPGYIARAMLGSSLGAGFDIGYQHAGNPASDWRCKLRFCTDGSLISWIAAGQLDRIGTVMIDEAHERSLNIDLIIGLLTQALPRYPHLKLIIASATIAADRFINHFAQHLPARAARTLRLSEDTVNRLKLKGALTEEEALEPLVGGGNTKRRWFVKEAANCELMEFAGKSFRVDPHFEDEEQLDYAYIDPSSADAAEETEARVRQLAKLAPAKVAEKAIGILSQMYLSADELRDGVGIRHTASLNPDGTEIDNAIVDITERRGDILGFLDGEQPILDCCDSVTEKASGLRCRVEALPLFTSLPQSAQDRALQERRPGLHEKLVDRIRALLASGATDILAVYDNVGQFATIQRMLTREAAGAPTVRTWASQDAVELAPDGKCVRKPGAELGPRAPEGPRVVLASSRALAVWGAPYDTAEDGGAIELDGQRLTYVAQQDEVRRVVVSTNVAETSLTIHGILHVVDSGLIKQSKWVRETQTTSLRPILQSRAGCKQRWGRAGRLQAGDAWTLYTREQFGLDADVSKPIGAAGDARCFPYYSEPEIRRSPLEQVLLTAKRAGIASLEPDRFPWLEAPETEELGRAEQSLRTRKALDENGDLTARGLELSTFQADARLANLMVVGDKMACAVEMATVLAALSVTNHQVHKLLVTDHDWDSATQTKVGEIQAKLTAPCSDDLEFVLRVIGGWELARSAGQALLGLWQWEETWTARVGAQPDGQPKGAAKLLEAMARAVTDEALAALRPRAKDALRPVFDALRAEARRGVACRAAWHELAPQWELLSGLEQFPRVWRAAATDESRIECVADEILETALAHTEVPDALLELLAGIERRSASGTEGSEPVGAEDASPVSDDQRRDPVLAYLSGLARKLAQHGGAMPADPELGPAPTDEERKLAAEARRLRADAHAETVALVRSLGEAYREPRPDHPGMAFIRAAEAARTLEELRELSGHERWVKRVREALPVAAGNAWCAANQVNSQAIVGRDKVEALRADLIDSLSGHKKETERRPINFALLTRLRLIFAHVLSDYCYEAVDGAYRPLAASGEPLSAEIDKSSISASAPPRLLACTSRKALPRQTDGERLLGLSFVVALDDEELGLSPEAIRGCEGRAPLSEWSALDLAAHLPEDESGSRAAEETAAARERFLSDQCYPLHSECSFRLISRCPEAANEWIAEGRVVAAPKPVELGYKKRPTGLGWAAEGDSGGELTTSTFAAPTPVPVLDLGVPDARPGAPSRPIAPVVETPMAEAVVGAEVGLLEEMVEERDEVGPIRALRLRLQTRADAPFGSTCRIRFLTQPVTGRDAGGQVVRAWVLSAERDDRGPVLTVGRTDPHVARQGLRLGDDYNVTVLGPAPGRRRGIQVHVAGTEVLASMTARDLCLQDESAVVDAMLAASGERHPDRLTFRARVWDLEPDGASLRLTTFAVADEWRGANALPGEGVLLPSNPLRPDTVSVLLHSEPTRGLFVVAEASAAQFADVSPGASVEVAVTQTRGKHRHSRVTPMLGEGVTIGRVGPGLELLPGGGLGFADRPMTIDEREALLEIGPTDRGYRSAIDTLYELSNQLTAHGAGTAAAACDPGAWVRARVGVNRKYGELISVGGPAFAPGAPLRLDRREALPEGVPVGGEVLVRPTGEGLAGRQVPVTRIPPPGWVSSGIVTGLEAGTGVVGRLSSGVEFVCRARELAPASGPDEAELERQVRSGTRLPFLVIGQKAGRAEVSHRRAVLLALRSVQLQGCERGLVPGRVLGFRDDARNEVDVELGLGLRATCAVRELGIGNAPTSHSVDLEALLRIGHAYLLFEVVDARPGRLVLSAVRAARLRVAALVGQVVSGAIVAPADRAQPYVSVRVADLAVGRCALAEFGASSLGELDPYFAPGRAVAVRVDSFDGAGAPVIRLSRARLSADQVGHVEGSILGWVAGANRGGTIVQLAPGVKAFAPNGRYAGPHEKGRPCAVQIARVNPQPGPGQHVITVRGADPATARPVPEPQAPTAPPAAPITAPSTDVAALIGGAGEALLQSVGRVEDAMAARDAAAARAAVGAMRSEFAEAEEACASLERAIEALGCTAGRQEPCERSGLLQPLPPQPATASRKAVDLDPGNALGLGNLAPALLVSGQEDEAVATYEGMNEAGAAKASDEGRVDDLSGDADPGRVRHDDVIAEFTKAAELDPKDAQAYHNRGVVYDELNRYDDAIADFTRALQLDPKYARAYYNRGVVYGKLNRYDDAIADYTRALQLDPKDALAYRNRGSAYSRLNRYDDAVADHTKAADLGPDDVAPWVGLGWAQYCLGHLRESITASRKAVDLDPGNVWGLGNLALALLASGKEDEAVTTYQRMSEAGAATALDEGCGDDLRDLIARRPDLAAVHYCYGLILEAAGQKNDAVREYQAYTAATPTGCWAESARDRVTHLQAAGR